MHLENKYFSYRVEWLRNLKIWKHYANYFPVKLIKTTELDSNENYIFGNHPHGILCSGAFACFATDGAGWSKIFPNLIPSLLTLQIFHLVPGFREVLRPSGEFHRRNLVSVYIHIFRTVLLRPIFKFKFSRDPI